MPADIAIRPASGDDQELLTDMQHAALFVPPGAEAFPRSILDEPGIRRYHAGFGTRAGDVGFVAVEPSGRRVGAVWGRLVAGYGHVDDDTPELGIAVVADRRGEGIGEALLRRFLDEVPRCSLSVDRRNPAIRLYERLGFRHVRGDGDHTAVMVHGEPVRHSSPGQRS